MSKLSLVVNNDPQDPVNAEKYRHTVSKAFLLAEIQNQINLAEQKRDAEYRIFQSELLKENNADSINKIMLSCVEQCANLRTLLHCSRLVQEMI